MENKQWKWFFFLCISYAEVDLKGGAGGTRPPYFLQSHDYWNHFAELEIVLFEVELIIDNAPSKYVYPNNKETCLSPNESNRCLKHCC